MAVDADSLSAELPSAHAHNHQPLAHDQSFVDSLNLETHGFVSFGYLNASRNNWLGPTTEGTGEFLVAKHPGAIEAPITDGCRIISLTPAKYQKFVRKSKV